MSKQRYYTANDLTISLYDKVAETSEFALLRMNKLYGSPDRDYQAWCDINDSITELVGKNDGYIAYLNHKTAEICAYRDALVNGNKFALNVARIESKMAKDSIKHVSGDINRMEAIAHLSKMQGYRINPAEVTVNEYYTLVKIFINGKGKQ